MKNEKKILKSWKFLSLVVLEGLLLFLIISSFAHVVSGVSGGNVTVKTSLLVGFVFPQVENITCNNFTASNITLVPNSTRRITCNAILVDYNGVGNITNATGQFFTPPGTYGGTDHNNYHYTNSSCYINYTFGSWDGIQQLGNATVNYSAFATCNFSLWYYSYPGTWNITVWVNTTTGRDGTGSNLTNVSRLLAVGLPDSINYGTVNATNMSNENITNVTNMGNVAINISLSGYAQTPGDGYAMNCSRGAKPFINISYERYNLSVSHPGVLNLSQASYPSYTNLTSLPLSGVVRKYELDFRHNDLIDNATNFTYWRIYVPRDVAGTCTGNIVFGATTASGS